MHKVEGLTAGLPLGLPEQATTVRVDGGEPSVAGGPYVDVKGAVGGYFVLGAEDHDAAVAVAAKVPAARLGGAIEVRPVAAYWGWHEERAPRLPPQALVAPRIEHLTTDQKVWGSNPSERARKPC